MAEADAAFLGPVDQRGGDRPRLRDQREPAGARGEMRDAELEPDAGDHQPDGVRPDDPQQMRPRRVQHGLTQRPVDPGAQHHRRAPAAGAELRHHLGRHGRGRDDRREVGRLGQIGGVGDAG